MDLSFLEPLWPMISSAASLIASFVGALPGLTSIPGLKWVIYTLLAIPVLLFAFLAVMNLENAHKSGRMTRAGYIVFGPFILPALALDVFVNLVPVTIALWDWPRLKWSWSKGEWTVTARFRRIAREDFGRRGDVVRWIARNFIDPFDIVRNGRHI